MSSLLFFDAVCQRPYSLRSLEESALGGTEASVVRIAEALDAEVMQHNRVAAEGRYRPPGDSSGVEHLVVLRDPRVLRTAASRFPGARVYLWLHDLVRPGSKRGRRLAAAAATLAQLDVTLVCVSDFQRRQAEAVLAHARIADRVRAVRIYNPIDDALTPNGTATDPDRLVFFSSPNKGLALTLDAFQALRRSMPQLCLRVGSPGYKSLERAGLERVEGRIAGVEWLGALPHARILEEVRSALCVFYPNFVLPETFGLALAEARAVGTPVLTHDCGAAAEVLADPAQVLPVTRAVRMYERSAALLPRRLRARYAACADRAGVFAPYVERIRDWRSGARPATGPDARFRTSTVGAQWRTLLGGKIA
ncbi:MAG TPA: glycosyltransferase [Steroidobacteraceae bacterium]|nr:glycosyltransferase [Steroidobacteraceae bacterium]